MRREHRWSRRRISDYVDGALDPADSRRLRRHAEICGECRELLRSLLCLAGALRSLGAPREPSVVGTVLEHLRREGFAPTSTGPPGPA